MTLLSLWSSTLRKLYFHFLSNLMGYDCGDSFPFNFEPNGNPFGSKSKEKLLPRSYPIQFDRKKKDIFTASAKFVFKNISSFRIIFLLITSLDMFPFYFEPNEIPFGSKLKGKLLRYFLFT